MHYNHQLIINLLKEYNVTRFPEAFWDAMPYSLEDLRSPYRETKTEAVKTLLFQLIWFSHVENIDMNEALRQAYTTFKKEITHE